MKSRFLSLLWVLLVPAGLSGQEQALRTWTSSDGKALEAVLVDADGETVALKTAKGMFKLPLARLSEADRTYIAEWRAGAPLKVGPWPDKVEISGDLGIEETGTDGQFTYHSPHFEFRSPTRLSKSVVREFARLFEATYEGVKALPVGFDPIPPKEGGRFLTHLYATREDYYAAGGMQGSGGMFSWRGRGREFLSGEIKVPLTSLGVEQVGNRYIIDQDKDSGTMVHEITHQVAVLWSVFGAPTWFTEGLAEYMEAAPYSKGTMRFTNMTGAVEKSVMEYSRDKEFRMLPVERLMTITSQEWANDLTSGNAGRNYRSANVLMTYFLHLDDPGNGEPVANYLRALREGDDPREAAAKHLLRGRDFTALAEDVRAKWRKVGFRLEYDS